MLNTKTRVAPSECPYCRISHDAMSALEDGAVPVRGSISLCANCGELAIYEVHFLRRPTPEELTDIQRSPGWPPIEQVMRGIKMFHAMTPEQRATFEAMTPEEKARFKP